MINNFLELLKNKQTLIADGAMGTSLFELGLQTGDAPELWNTEQPEKIKSVYKSFVDAGSDIILTNSFGGTSFRLKLHKAQDRVFELNKKTAELAREIADDSGRMIAVAGSMGPTGELLVPMGQMTYEEAVAGFLEQAKGLKAGRADVLWVETMSSTDEAIAAIEAGNITGLPVICTMTYDTVGKTMMGISPEEATQTLCSLETPPVAIGANCGVGPTDTMLSILKMRASNPDAIIISKANCGIPQYKNGKFFFTGTPELMGRYARIAVDAGVRIIGGCCGSSPTVIKSMADAIEGYNPQPINKRIIIETLGEPINLEPKTNVQRKERRRIKLKG